jgi:hypothetical protein
MINEAVSDEEALSVTLAEPEDQPLTPEESGKLLNENLHVWAGRRYGDGDGDDGTPPAVLVNLLLDADLYIVRSVDNNRPFMVADARPRDVTIVGTSFQVVAELVEGDPRHPRVDKSTGRAIIETLDPSFDLQVMSSAKCWVMLWSDALAQIRATIQPGE